MPSLFTGLGLETLVSGRFPGKARMPHTDRTTPKNHEVPRSQMGPIYGLLGNSILYGTVLSRAGRRIQLREPPRGSH